MSNWSIVKNRFLYCGLLLCMLIGCASHHNRNSTDLRLLSKQQVAEESADTNFISLIDFAESDQRKIRQARFADSQEEPLSENAIPIKVAADQQWHNTGIIIQAGQSVCISARGKITVGQSQSTLQKQPIQVGPQGTYLYADEVIGKPFPLPSTANGPAPCYGLIGAIGDQQPFFIGQKRSWVAQADGELRLGINDYDVSNNQGEFQVFLEQGSALQPVSYQIPVSQHGSPGQPLAKSSVVIFYLDGLRPDVVREMAALGHLPYINQYFLEEGVHLANSFTAFPSDTITSNGTMWTGCFSDRHGLKGQVRFSRRTLQSESYLETLGPNRSARLLSPQGIDGALLASQSATIGLLQGKTAATKWRSQKTTAAKPLYQRLRSEGTDWATGILPIMTDTPPILWSRSLVRHIPYLQAQNAWQYIDDANTHYAQRHLLHKNKPVTIIWLPETDSVSHKQSRGQFGLTRRTIARADELIGNVIEQLRAQARLDSTYLMLVSDHGHHGGRTRFLKHFDLANELFFAPREVSPQGQWIGGGLGMSVRQHRYWNRHSEDGSRAFVFIDGLADGTARIFLPRKRFQSGNWRGEPKPGDLLKYQLSDRLKHVNLVHALTNAKTLTDKGAYQHPIDLILLKLDENSLLIVNKDRGVAVIDRKRNDQQQWVYRYQPVTSYGATPDGQIEYQLAGANDVDTDPLEILSQLSFEMLSQYYDEQAWLQITTPTRYPDSVVSLTRHMLWQKELKYREKEFAPDLVVTARPGWYFGREQSPGTMHGYPLRDAMLASWFISGPNIRKGARIEKPCRLVDLTPTLLQMTGIPFEQSELDGHPLTDIYQSDERETIGDGFLVQTSGQEPGLFQSPGGREDPKPVPVFWNEIDLQGWHGLQYLPQARSPHMSMSINQPTKPYDLNNIVYNLISLSDFSPFRLLDDLMPPITTKRRRLSRNIEWGEGKALAAKQKWVGEAVTTLDIPGLALGDYSITSIGNLKRADRMIDFVQARGDEVNRTIAHQVKQKELPGIQAARRSVDTVQSGFWNMYQYAQRLIVQLLDETVINGIENSTDRTINTFLRSPAEIIVDE